MNTKIVVTDMDDVLVDLLPMWVRELNRRFNLNVAVSDIKEWDMQKAFPKLTKEQIYTVLDDPAFWDKVEPKEHSVEGLSLIQNAGLNVYVCTATHYRNVEKKITNCLMKFYPTIDYKHIIMCHDKSLIKCDYIIDDYADNIKNSSGIKILMNQPHNRSATEKDYDFRVNSMLEVFDLIMQMEDILKYTLTEK